MTKRAQIKTKWYISLKMEIKKAINILILLESWQKNVVQSTFCNNKLMQLIIILQGNLFF